MKKFLLVFCALLIATPAYASWGIVDSLDLTPFVPTVLDALMSVATGTYEFFVGKGDGIIYMLIWGILGISIGLYLVKMYFPKNWLSFFGFKDGGEMWEGKTTGFNITEKLLKNMVRAIVAATILLQIKPIYVTDWLVNPFLEFGALYTEGITTSMNLPGVNSKTIQCPKSVTEKGWISEKSCWTQK